MRGLRDNGRDLASLRIKPRSVGGRCGDARRATPLTPRKGARTGPLHDTEALRRRHGFLANRRARRLNLRPPGAV